MSESTLNLRALISEPDAAKLLLLSTQTLRNKRCAGAPLVPYVKLGRRIAYRPEVVEKFIEQNTVGAK
jgi:hypothetical protein